MVKHDERESLSAIIFVDKGRPLESLWKGDMGRKCNLLLLDIFLSF